MKSHIKTTRFWLAWTSASLLVYPMVIALLLALSLVISPIMEVLIPNGSLYEYNTIIETLYLFLTLGVVGAMVGFCVGTLQKTVVRRYFGINMGKWTQATVVGGFISGGVMSLIVNGMTVYISEHYWQLYETGQYDTFSTLISIMPMVLYVTIMSITQVVILRRYVQSAWLWIVANGVSGMTFSVLVFGNFNPGYGDWFLAALAQGAVTGFAMLWLLHRLNRETTDSEPELAFQHVPIDTDDPSDPSIWDDAL